MGKLTFLGTGTSQGVPMISCGCWICSSTDSRDKRLRSSVLIEYQGVTMVIDAGPDFRQQMLREEVTSIDAILLTHEHKDHIAGLDDVRAFNYTMGQAVDIYAETRVQSVIRKDFDYAFAEIKYPGVPLFNLKTIDEHPFTVNGVEITPIRGKHFKLPVLGFRIGDMAYITDFNEIKDSEIEKIKGVKILVINGLRKEHHISHFSLDEALHISYLVGSQATYITHISHQLGRFVTVEPTLPPNTHLAYDGLKIDF